MKSIGSLFSGIGGIELGLEMCGFDRVAWQCEIDPYARAVLEKHWPGTKRYEDIRSLDGSIERPTIICGGFPCQNISSAGKKEGITGTKSGLWSEYARIIRELRPRYVFVENVSAIVGRGLDRVLGDLSESGYDAEWETFSSASVGAPFDRKRTFILGSSADRDGEPERQIHDETPFVPITGPTFWESHPAPVGVVDGVSEELDRRQRLRCCGNAVVPQLAALAYQTLFQRIT